MTVTVQPTQTYRERFKKIEGQKRGGGSRMEAAKMQAKIDKQKGSSKKKAKIDKQEGSSKKKVCVVLVRRTIAY